MRRRLAIIGGGPVGIEAALAFANGGQYSEIAVYERGSEYAANVKLWGHVRLFSPWEFNTSRHGAAQASYHITAPPYFIFSESSR